MSDSEEQESIQSYDSDNQDEEFKEDYDYQEESVKPKIKIGALIDKEVIDDSDEMEYGGMGSDEEEYEDEDEEDFEAPQYLNKPTMSNPDDEEMDYERTQLDEDEDEPTQVGKIIAVDSQVKLNSDENDVESSDEDTSEDEDEGYFQKLDKEVLSNYIDIHHPESRVHNYDEVRSLSKVTRNKDGVIVDELHRTLPFLTKFEKARIIGIRSKQLNEGAKPFVKTPPNVVTGYAIAILELATKKIPFIIRRPIPNGGSEYWRVSDLELII